MAKRHELETTEPVLYRCPHCREEQYLPFDPAKTKGSYGYVVRVGIRQMATYKCIKCNKNNLED